MTLTSTFPITVEGVRLDTLAWNITEVTPQVAGVRSTGLYLPGTDGETFDGWEDAEPSAYGLSMWVRGTDVDGVVPGVGSIATLEQNLDALTFLFRGTRHRLLDVRRTIAVGVERQAMCVVRDVLQPKITPGSVAEFSVGLVIPAGVWQDPTTGPSATTNNYVSGTVITLTGLAGSTAPIHDGAFVVRGPATNPTLTDQATGAFVRYGGVLGVNDAWYVDSANWTSKVGVIPVGGTPVDAPTWRTLWAAIPNAIASTTWGLGTSRLLTLVPAMNAGVLADRRVKVALTGTGFGVNTQVWVEHRRRFLT